ncbi:hypothetical protein MtrunA17_Chr4g0070081 [Medicago truncatula]|uniref:Transmembrane protein, putative n=1 Tax=Medicago truncatula TaxID=3880 RepID=G7JS58_MEDTR|nr:uncharacterized protein LOC11440735 [Medicago truncatula]AES92156.1 transmembrane protein, putative [Medicago truncatula]RHN64530.1 hypothetical protein MtrunA17_Chr4g0070081 [Medicago truncatula]
MDGAVKTVVKVSGDHKTSSSTTPSYDSSYVLATRPSRQVLSYWTCSKLCAICFVGGVIFGYTLRGRVKRWASKILNKLT